MVTIKRIVGGSATNSLLQNRGAFISCVYSVRRPALPVQIISNNGLPKDSPAASSSISGNTPFYIAQAWLQVP